METLIRTQLEADGVLVATIDMPDRTMNVFSADLMEALDALMDRVDADAQVRSVVLTSGKPTFLAGADLVMVRGYTESAKTATHEQMFAKCGRLGRQFVRLEQSAKPWVAAVNGIALGGGLELALACRVRIVSDEPRTQIGVPEVRWGLLPGAGGTQRLPRLAGFEAAMDLLLSGRSIAPAEAVRLGIFARTVPAAQLLDEARAEARAMHGKAYDVKAKFAKLAQADVSPFTAEGARAIALRHGVSDADFDLYPAYSAIVDSVLKGARLSLAEATDVEMTQFLRLMFNPVAGHMVRTLFLERLRAERELAAPKGTAIERLAVGPLRSSHKPWIDALARLKVAQAPDAALGEGTIDIVDAQGGRHPVALATLDSPLPEASMAAVLAPVGPYGRVLEIIGGDDQTAALLCALAPRLGALPWRTPGPASVLQQLRGATLEEQARTALKCAAAAGAGDIAFLDVAACLSGVTPAWTGGPLTWLWAGREKFVPAFDAASRDAWNRLQPALHRAFA
ncbi:3-hydroxyacyl-CoA dehydrogenase / enoyl-CoA hydratase / 3-hydroxybutyryl-CoA epimerase [Variovorax sp. HW608]|uniref:enoyl-CoA hydratase-related protein n=1 Tax=Variovorax sp. HW608 TaxID=1034889 RepID=UPI00081F9500|nr:enoyl-CoA hydratase-related protein [Variovorax sp. HW608]SCK31061.1 3-hydroxyacyl-CoA dehydrogenase / enoyl-CoA hydratase / 3-hydroxybutyryl-CoA epimerase [Variovorax sp. HW608]